MRAYEFTERLSRAMREVNEVKDFYLASFGIEKDLDSGNFLEATHFGEACVSEDGREGINAFIDLTRRHPELLPLEFGLLGIEAVTYGDLFEATPLEDSRQETRDGVRHPDPLQRQQVGEPADGADGRRLFFEAAR